MDIIFSDTRVSFQTAKDTLIIGVTEDGTLTEFGDNLDQNLGGIIKRALTVSDFKGKIGKTYELLVPSPHLSRLIFVGIGKDGELSSFKIEKIGASIMSTLDALTVEHAHVALDLGVCGSLTAPQVSSYLASGICLRSYKFDQYKTQKEPKKVELNTITIYTSNLADSEACFFEREAIYQGSILTRLVVDESPNVIYPESLAQKAKNELKHLGVSVEILGEKELRKLGFNAMLGVAQGSEKEPQLVILHWKGGPEEQAPIAFVGKGVTFDSGGISIKPAANMDDMKADMAGAGVVLGLMKTLALRKAKVNVVGVMGLVENMPSGSAQRPADVVVSLSGQTIEVLNTDAEGRLVLADALWYTQDRFKPQAMIDLATLTGAIVVALGHEYAGLFSNSDDLSYKITESGIETGELVWRMPMNPAYLKDIESSVADVQNIGSGRGAGSITAAHFLEKFVNKCPWVHLDIAGMEMNKKSRPLTGKGATGFGVRLLNHFLHNFYEKK